MRGPLPIKLLLASAMTLPALGALAMTIGVRGATSGGCGAPTAEAIAAAEIVFVGTLTTVNADGAGGVFEIDDVWHSAEWALVDGDSVMVTASAGFPSMPLDPSVRTYLVVAQNVGGALQVGAGCPTYLLAWDPAYAAWRPADESAPPTADGGLADGGLPELPGPLLVLTGAAVAIGAGAYLAFRAPRRQP